MEQAYDGKCVFLTGGTGFLGKAVVEKILRSAPQVQQVGNCVAAAHAAVIVLIRPRKGVNATERLQNELLKSPIFNRLRRERSDFDSFAASKLIAVAGDVTEPQLGLSREDAQMIRSCAQITIHSAATVQFTEPLAVAVEMNCVGAMTMLDFVKTCERVLLHVHVSTAYVNCNLREAHIREELYPLDFDVDDALKAVTEASPSELERLSVNLMGTYPNTYALTKSMSEHLLVKNIGDIPLLIYRPTIIGASWKEPVPGWIDQIAGMGAIFLAAGLGVLTMLPGDPRNVADVVPVDLAVNHLLLSICAKLVNPLIPQPFIVHSGTSDPRQNNLRWRIPIGIVPDYFRKNPPPRSLFPCKFHMYPSHQQFQIQWFLSYALPSSVYSTLANKFGSANHVKNAARLWQLTWRARTLVEVFKPFTENQWMYHCDNSAFLEPYETDDWWIDSHQVVWERYVINFCVGLKKFIMHEDVIDVDVEGVTHTELALSTNRMLAWDPDHHAISFPGLIPDISWAYTSSRKPGYTKSGIFGRIMGLTGWKEGMNHEASHVPRQHIESIGGVRNLVLETEGVREAIANKAREKGLSIDDVEEEAVDILDEMAATLDYKSVRKLGWILRKFMRQIYEKIYVDEKGLIAIRDLMSKQKGSVVLVPTHRSYMDFLLMSFICFAYNIPVPHIAAGRDFMSMGWISKILRESGAYFIRRSFQDDPLYAAVFRSYTQYLVTKGHTVEFFIEGSRSRSGKQLHPKFGILSTVVDCYLSGNVENLHVVPVTIDYEKPLEVMLHQNELLGEGKIKESIGALLKSLSVARENFGSISVQFGQPIDIKQYVAQYATQKHSGIVRDLAYDITDSMIACAACMPSHLVATVLLNYRNGISKSVLVQQTNLLRLEILKRGGRVVGSQGRTPTAIVDHALELLKDLVVRRRKDLVEPAITSREQYQNMIGLGYYRNKILHWFNREGVVACAFHALEGFNPAANDQSGKGVDRKELLQGALFLHDLLRMEFVRKDCSQDRQQLEDAVDHLLAERVLRAAGDGQRLAVSSGGQSFFSMLRTLFWPFVDSYWVAITSLFALRPGLEISMDDLLKRIQWLAETMYHERVISFYESCSLETITNALSMLEQWQVIERVSALPSRKPSSSPMIRLLPPFERENELERLALRVTKFRKSPSEAVDSADRETQLITRLPSLSKM